MITDTIEQFRKELREAVLTKKIEVKYKRLTDSKTYQYEMRVRIIINPKTTKEILFSVSDLHNFICYHEPLTDGIFDNDIKELTNIATFGCTRLEYEDVPHNESRTTFQEKCIHRDTCKMWHNCTYNRDR